MYERSAKISELATLISLSFVGNDIEINTLGLCNRESEYGSVLSYLGSLDYLQYAIGNKTVKAIVMHPLWLEQLKEHEARFSFILSDTPQDDFYRLHRELYTSTPFYNHYDFDPIVGKDCSIHPTAVIERGVILGDRVTVGAYSVVGRRATVGDDCHIGRLSVVGSEGFQALRLNDGTPYNALHVGGTKLGRGVWVGDNVTICNSLFEGQLEIGDHCLIDNHCQIAHNCRLGTGNVLTAGVILLGSAEIQNNCWLAPGSMVMNQVTVENNGFVGANSMANNTVKQGTTVTGTPAVEIGEFAKRQYALKKLTHKK